jgi:hypothetical protein
VCPYVTCRAANAARCRGTELGTHPSDRSRHSQRRRHPRRRVGVRGQLCQLDRSAAKTPAEGEQSRLPATGGSCQAIFRCRLQTGGRKPRCAGSNRVAPAIATGQAKCRSLNGPSGVHILASPKQLPRGTAGFLIALLDEFCAPVREPRATHSS